MREGWWTPKIPQVRDWLIKVLSCKDVLPFKQNDDFEGRAVGQTPRRVILSSWNVMEFTWLCLDVG